MRRFALLVAFVLVACVPAPQVRSLAPLHVRTICLVAISGRTPPEVVEDVRARVELALSAVGVVGVESGCEVRGEVSVVGGYQWVLGWYAERLTLQIRNADGKLLGSIEQAGPLGGPGYVSMLVDDFTAAVANAFREKR